MKRNFYVVFAYTLFLVVSLTAFAQESPQAVIPLNGLDPVCNGALLLARAGLLNDRKATTHWASIGRLKKEAATATVLENVRFVDNGQVLTTAGVSAGIDGALHVVDRLLGRPAAQLTARYMEYEWKPVKKPDVSAKPASAGKEKLP
jgi:transcriptional regulator GlxA family with amidase domain